LGGFRCGLSGLHLLILTRFRPFVLNDAQPVDRQFIDLKRANACFLDHEAADDDAADRKRTDGDSTEGGRAERERQKAASRSRFGPVRYFARHVSPQSTKQYVFKDRYFVHLTSSMRSAAIAIALSALAFLPLTAFAGMGPCAPADFDLICGSGDGAARVVLKTISPSKRLAFAWRLSDRPPSDIPRPNDPNLENFIVRIADGAIVAKSHGSYWDLSTKIAKAYLFTAWSSDSRLLVKVQQNAEASSAEFFSFAEDGSAAGPFELVNLIKPAMLAKIRHTENAGDNLLIFASHPAMAIGGDGLLHVAAFLRRLSDTAPYDVTVQLGRRSDSLDAKVVAIMEHSGPTVSVIVH
jgi:hypothetical protein